MARDKSLQKKARREARGENRKEHKSAHTSELRAGDCAVDDGSGRRGVVGLGAVALVHAARHGLAAVPLALVEEARAHALLHHDHLPTRPRMGTDEHKGQPEKKERRTGCSTHRELDLDLELGEGLFVLLDLLADDGLELRLADAVAEHHDVLRVGLVLAVEGGQRRLHELLRGAHELLAALLQREVRVEGREARVERRAEPDGALVRLPFLRLQSVRVLQPTSRSENQLTFGRRSEQTFCLESWQTSTPQTIVFSGL